MVLSRVLALVVGVSVLVMSIGSIVLLLVDYVSFRPVLDPCEELLADVGLGRVGVDGVWREDGLIYVSTQGSVVIVSPDGRVVGCGGMDT